MDHPEQIRRQIALYRQHLAEGVEGDRTVFYLREIKRLETKLAQPKATTTSANDAVRDVVTDCLIGVRTIPYSG